jgi:tetratricopeptide (TPR) repeat protein
VGLCHVESLREKSLDVKLSARLWFELKKFQVKRFEEERMTTTTPDTFTVLSIDGRLDERRQEQEQPQERTYVQLRRELDVGAFGVFAVRADAGKRLVAERTTTGYAADRHEELFVVLGGAATFTVDGEEVDAPAGTAVFVRDVEAKRGAVATEDGTTLLVVGGRRGEAWRPTPGEAMQAFFPHYEAKDYEAALRIAEQALEEYPGNGLALFNVACMESLLGRKEEALAHLRSALDAAPQLGEQARTDADFEPLRGDARFEALVSERVEQEA